MTKTEHPTNRDPQQCQLCAFTYWNKRRKAAYCECDEEPCDAELPCTLEARRVSVGYERRK